MDKLEPLDNCYGTTFDEIERTLRFALDIVSDGIWDWNIRTDHVKRSPGWYSMLGYPSDSLPEDVDTWKSVIHPGDFEQVMRGFQAYLDGQSLIYAEDYRCRCRDGSYLWVSDHGRFVEFDGAGKPTRMIGAHRNIHQRKMASLELLHKNEELLALNRKLEALVEARTEALRQAERLRLLVGQADPGLPPGLTASFSVAAMQVGEGIESLLKRLDDGLYRAKRRRNCIEAC